MFHIDTCPFSSASKSPPTTAEETKAALFFLAITDFFGKEHINMYLHTYILFNVCIHIYIYALDCFYYIYDIW